jgi:CRISPR-associated endonuclease/helicase Cas3
MDAELTSADFVPLFKAVWGFDPFPWQERLLLRLVTGEDAHHKYKGEPGLWPDVLDLPTGSGKTAALDIAVFHLALEALKKDKREAPLRVAFIVDRRLIVDDAYERANRIAEALRWSLLSDEAARCLESKRPDLTEAIRRVRAEAVVKRTALRLRELAGPDQPPLIARFMRGGAPREDDWARTPVQPTILCSTVDQVGSRLLFRGYGVSDRMKPVHAGLLGSDCLILLDEAHLSEPFRQTLKAVEHLRAPDKAPFGFAVLTATPSVISERPFGLTSEDYSDPILSARTAASKPARLIELPGKQGVETEPRVETVVAEAKATLGTLQARITNPAVGVIVNRVARARAIFERLRTELAGDADVTLIIGPARSIDRDNRAAELSPIRTRSVSVPRALPKPLVVVATQTIEAGVDIDFDGLVTEAAALDALRQRFGRLNRAGRRVLAEAAIVAHKDDIGAKADDPVYGNRIAKTWEAMNRWKENHPDDCIDFGISAMNAVLANEKVDELVAEGVDAPILLPAYADLWSQTWPIPSADPDAVLFLHGPDRAPATVQIVWRADLGRDLDAGNRARLVELFTLLPPRAAEAVEVPLWAARAWLRQEGVDKADFSDAVEPEPDAAREQEAGRRAFRWAGEDSGRTNVVNASELRNGDLIVVPAEYGGCDEWGWNPKSTAAVIDVAEDAFRPYRAGRFAVRLTPELIEQRTDNERVNRSSIFTANRHAGNLIATLAEHAEDHSRRLLDAVLGLDVPEQRKRDLEALRQARGNRLQRVFAYGFGADERPRGVIFVAPRGINEREELELDEPEEELAAVPATESDDLGVVSDQSVALIDHCQDVRAWAESFAIRAGLGADQLTDIALAAYLHDLGKADPRFQTFLAGGDPYGPDWTEPLAKSGVVRLPADAWARAGLPTNWRHEALSVRLALLHPEFAHAHDPALVLWLIGTHHGYGRPLFSHKDDKDAVLRSGLLKAFGSDGDLAPRPGPQSLAFNFGGWDWAQIFERLKQRYGVWGLARLEAFVRLADHRASQEKGPPQYKRNYKEAAE